MRRNRQSSHVDCLGRHCSGECPPWMIAQAAKQLEQIANYRKEFDKYKKEFDKYFLSFGKGRISQGTTVDAVQTVSSSFRTETRICGLSISEIRKALAPASLIEVPKCQHRFRSVLTKRS